MQAIHDFFVELDRTWSARGEPFVRLQLIGASALLLQTNYERGTKDSDVLESTDLTPNLKRRLLEIAGPQTALARRRRLYLEFVAPGLPFLPQRPSFHPVEPSSTKLTSIGLHVLDVVDVVVSKLKRYHSNDAADIDRMITLGLVDHERLLARFRDAVDVWADGAYADDLPTYVKNLHTVERDAFLVAPTPIELPSWVDD